MSLSEPFVHRPVGTTLLTIAIAMAGGLAYFFLPVSPLPQVEFPTISVGAALPGASPETMASAVATPLERQFGRIAGVTEMTSQSFLGNSSITLQFDLSRNIDAAARDVQAAINAARGQLPTNLPSNPTYRKVNPADAPIMLLSITSATYDRAKMYDAASTILQQKIAQVQGVGQVVVGGAALPAIRVDVSPTLLNNFGLGMEDVRSALAAANAHSPKGALADQSVSYMVGATDQIFDPAQYKNTIISFRNGGPVRLIDVAPDGKKAVTPGGAASVMPGGVASVTPDGVVSSIEDVHTGGLDNGRPAIMLVIFRQPGANIIATVDRVKALMPTLSAEIPAGMKLAIAMDRTTTIRSSVNDVQITLLLSIALVILVVFFFLRSGRATFIPSVVVPVSLIGTFGVMYLLHYSIDNLSLMALTIATGFVVDDAIVVIENVTRHLEEGLTPMQAALRGASEIGFTVLSISISLIAVFIPILLMTGIIGRLFREFAVVLSVAVGVSMVISLTTTPMMCAVLLRSKDQEKQTRFYRVTERFFGGILSLYERALTVVLRHGAITLGVLLGTIALTVYLVRMVPKGFLPQQDTGRLTGTIIADQDVSFAGMSKLVADLCKVVQEDPDVTGVDAFIGGNFGGALNSARMFVTLKPNDQRKLSADQIIARLRKNLSQVAGGTLFLQGVQDVRIGGRPTSSQYQFTLQGDDLNELKEWAPKIQAAMKKLPGLADVTSDQQDHGLNTQLVVDRATAIRLGITQSAIDNTLYDNFGQRQVSTMYTPLNQYHVVMEAAPWVTHDPEGLRYIYVAGRNGKQAPLSAFARWGSTTSALQVNHSGQFPSITLSFNLEPGVSLSEAVILVQKVMKDIEVPADIHGNFSGTAQAYQDSLSNEVILVIAALLTVYIVLGILYESYIHPITIISTLPSAGVGALLALKLCNVELDVMSIIGIILLIGIVKKNAIMMIDFALDAERNHGKSPHDAIFEACLLRFRPIVMTTMAALLGALPLAIGAGTGGELRQPMGIAIVGGLIFSQILTLFTTPVVYLNMDRLRLFLLAEGRDHPLARIAAASA